VSDKTGFNAKFYHHFFMKLFKAKPWTTSQVGLIALIATLSAPTGTYAIETAPSGLQYKIITPGQGQQATSGKFVKVHFKGKLPNGIVFSNSRDKGAPFEFKLGSSNIPAGLNEGIGLLKEGGKAELIVPPSLGYGDKGTSGVPPNSTMEFEIELIKVSSVPSMPTVPPKPAQPTITLANFRSNPALNSPINLRSPKKSDIQLAIALVTNEIRKKNGTTVLPISSHLINAAQMHADDMVKDKFFSHYNNGDQSKYDPQKRARMHGVTNPIIAENINQGFAIRYTPGAQVRPVGGGVFTDMAGRRLSAQSPITLADALLTTWMESPGHKTNILDPVANSIGCGISFYSNPEFYQIPSVYAVQKFQRSQPIKVEITKEN
jgi:peptidylprolyl isomerase